MLKLTEIRNKGGSLMNNPIFRNSIQFHHNIKNLPRCYGVFVRTYPNRHLEEPDVEWEIGSKAELDMIFNESKARKKSIFRIEW